MLLRCQQKKWVREDLYVLIKFMFLSPCWEPENWMPHLILKIEHKELQNYCIINCIYRSLFSYWRLGPESEKQRTVIWNKWLFLGQWISERLWHVQCHNLTWVGNSPVGRIGIVHRGLNYSFLPSVRVWRVWVPQAEACSFQYASNRIVSSTAMWKAVKEKHTINPMNLYVLYCPNKLQHE